MRSPTLWLGVVAALGLSVGALSGCSDQKTDWRKPAKSEWPMGGGDWGNTRYSALAGFVEPGETLESTVIRETREEVGVEIKNIRYFGSQPWPFPNSLMLGFYAQWERGEIVIDPSEIVDAKWFHVDELPPFPGSMSIASQLINGYIRIRRPTGR